MFKTGGGPSNILKWNNFCVQIVVLDQGQVVEVGTHTQLLERGGKYANLWRHQQQEQENQGEEKKTGEDEEEWDEGGASNKTIQSYRET